MIAIDEITEVLNLYRELSGVGVCFYDLDDFFRYGTEGHKENVGHYCEFCKCVKLLPGGQRACNMSDRLDAVAMAREYQAPFFTTCHVGMTELVLPIYEAHDLKGIIFLGQCRLKGEDNAASVARAAAALGGEAEKFGALYRALPVISRQSLLSMGKILQHYFNNLAALNSVFPNSASLEIAKKPLGRRIADYIEKNYRNPLSLKSISARLYLNESYVARVFKKEMGCTVTAYINRVRIDNAVKLLTATKAPMRSIALNVGYPDANYFTRVFTKLTSKTPGEVRRGERTDLCSLEQMGRG